MDKQATHTGSQRVIRDREKEGEESGWGTWERGWSPHSTGSGKASLRGREGPEAAGLRLGIRGVSYPLPEADQAV